MNQQKPQNSNFRNYSQQKQQGTTLKPLEKLADDPIEPPSPKSSKMVCTFCKGNYSSTDIEDHQQQCEHQQINQNSVKNNDNLLKKLEKLEKAIDENIGSQKQNCNTLQQRQANEKDQMASVSLYSYVQKLKELLKTKIQSNDKQFSTLISEKEQQAFPNQLIKDFESCKELLKNVSYLEANFSGSLPMLWLIQRMKVITKEFLTNITKQIKDSNTNLGGSMSSTNGLRITQNTSMGPRSVKSEVSEEMYKEKMEEVSKTRKEMEYLQKRTSELMQVLNIQPIKNSDERSSFKSKPNQTHQNKFVIEDIKSEVDSQTVISEGSGTQKSVITTSSVQSNPYTPNPSVFQGHKKILARAGSNESKNQSNQGGVTGTNQGGGMQFEECEEIIQIESNKREKERKQNLKVQFYEICFNMKNRVFPDNHLAKYANIPALYEEAIKQDIPSEKYQEFVYNQLSKNAQLWVSMKELNQIRKKNKSISNQSSPGYGGYKQQTDDLMLNMKISPIKNSDFHSSNNKMHKSSNKKDKRKKNGGGVQVHHHQDIKIETIMEEDDNSFLQENE